MSRDVIVAVPSSSTVTENTADAVVVVREFMLAITLCAVLTSVNATSETSVVLPISGGWATALSTTASKLTPA